MPTQVRDESSFARWYANNKQALSEKRKNRYHSDKKYRNRQLEASKRWRKDNPLVKSKKEPPITIGIASEMLEVCPQTLRSLEKRGLIPVNKKGLKHRVYTTEQIELMRPLIEYLKEHHYHYPRYEKKTKFLAQKIKTSWKGNKNAG